MEYFPYLRLQAGFESHEKLAAYLNVTPQTVKNWDKKGAPKAVRLLMHSLTHDLSWIHKDWAGCWFDLEGNIRGATRQPMHIGPSQSLSLRSESHDALCLTAFPTPHDRACETVIAFGAWAVLRSLARRQQGRLTSFHNDFTAFRDALQSASGQR